MDKNEILQFIQNKWQTVRIDFRDDSWLDQIPSAAGWYFISSNAPPRTFQKLPQPKQENHYNIPDRASRALAHRHFGICILPEKDPVYIVYASAAEKLKLRARDHIMGAARKGCLALAEYILLHRYEWSFHFVPCPPGNTPKAGRVLMKLGWQAWRSTYGWPILCEK